jgi:hypothetical protein
MKIKIAILFVGLFLTINAAFGNFSAPVMDTSYQPNSLKESAFLKQYGTDDTSRALILHWFTKRHLFSALTILSGAGTVGLAVSPGSQKGTNSAAGFYAIGLVLGIAVGTMVTIAFLIPFLTHSRKKLLRLLTNYRDNGALPKKYRKKLVIDK